MQGMQRTVAVVSIDDIRHFSTECVRVGATCVHTYDAGTGRNLLVVQTRRLYSPLMYEIAWIGDLCIFDDLSTSMLRGGSPILQNDLAEAVLRYRIEEYHSRNQFAKPYNLQLSASSLHQLDLPWTTGSPAYVLAELENDLWRVYRTTRQTGCAHTMLYGKPSILEVFKVVIGF